jgi:di/tricarboxylate transporter
MTWQGWLCLGVVGLVILGLYFDLVSCTAMMYCTTLILMLATVIDSKQYVAGLSNTGVVTIAQLFIVVDPIAKLPLVKYAVTRLLESGNTHDNIYFIRFKLCLLAMLLSPFTNLNPLIVLLTPIVVSYCRERDLPHAQLLMPMAYAGAFGGSWTVIGTSVNLVYDGLMVGAELGHMAFFELIKTTIIPSIVGLVYLVFVPSFVLSSSTDGNSFKLALTKSSRFLAQFVIKSTSPLVGMQAWELKQTMPHDLRKAVDLIELSRKADAVVHAPPRPNDFFEAEDLVVFSGPVAALISYAKILHLEWVPHESDDEQEEVESREDRNKSAFDGIERASSTVVTHEPADASYAFPSEEQGGKEMHSDEPPRRMSECRDRSTNDVSGEERRLSRKESSFRRRMSGLAVRQGLSLKRKVSCLPPEPEPLHTPNHDFSSPPNKRARHPEFLEVTLDFRSQAIGTSVGSAFFRHRYNATILAVRPVEGTEIIGSSQLLHHHVLKQGDNLLVYGDPTFVSTFSSEFSLVVQDRNEAEQSSKDIAKNYIVVPQWFPLGTDVGKSDITDTNAPANAGGHGSAPVVTAGMKLLRLPEHYHYLSLVVFIGMVAFTIAGFQIFVTSAIAVVLFVSLKLMTVHDAVHAIDFNVMLQIAYSFGLGSGMSSSSLAGVIGNGLSSAHVSGFKFYLLIAALGSIVTNAITNKACAQVMFPIVVAVQKAAHQDPLPAVMVLVSVSCWTFCTSYGGAGNLIIMGPGGYCGKDYAKLGVVLTLIMIPLVAGCASLVYGSW